MKFEPHTIYHIFNQGNNRQPIFFQERNYYFFLEKMKTHLLPYGDIIAYCLMPNHFHWLFYTNESASQYIPLKPRKTIDKESIPPQQKLCRAIGTLLSSYTKAINKQEDRSGSLFRAKTKAKDGAIDDIITVDGKYQEMFFRIENDYALKCFEYIHQNPVETGLVTSSQDWPFSSAKDYRITGNSNSLCNTKLGKRIFKL